MQPGDSTALDFIPRSCRNIYISLVVKGRVLEAHLDMGRERCLRADLHSAPGRLRASFTPVLRPVREVQSLDWDR